MSSAVAVGRFLPVDNDLGPGSRIRTRRKALGIQAGRLATMAEVNREHLSAVENGHKIPTDEWVRRVELAMDDYARETGQDEPVEALEVPVEPIRLTFHDVYGIGEIIAEAPADHGDELVAAVMKLMSELRTTRNKGQQ